MLHSHLTSVEVPPGVGSPSLAPGTLLSDLLDALLTSGIVTDLLNTVPDAFEGEEVLEKAALEVANAIQRSLRGARLIGYSDLPHPWRNNPFVTQGYRSGLKLVTQDIKLNTSFRQIYTHRKVAFDLDVHLYFP